MSMKTLGITGVFKYSIQEYSSGYGYIRAHTHVDNLDGGDHRFIFDYAYDDKSKSIRSFGQDELGAILADPMLSFDERKMVGEAARDLRVAETEYLLRTNKTTLAPTVLQPTL